MQENKLNAKCPHCGAELYLGYNQGTGFCPTCRKSFDNDKAIKLYQSVHQTATENEQKKTASFGEEYLEVEKILTRAEYYFERKQFRSAREELEKALAITNTDYRIYFGIVRAETKNLTDYRNESHKEFLQKAIECADNDQKKTITRLYKNFFQLSKLSDEDILQYKKEENDAIKSKLEEKFKALIPIFMKKEKGQKTNVILSAVFALLAIVAGVFGFIYNVAILLSLSVGLLALTYFFARKYFSFKKLNALFNALLDVYDALNSFDFDVYVQREVLDQMKFLRKAFTTKNNLNNCEDGIASLCTLLTLNANETSRKFVLNHKLLSKYANTYDAD